MMSVKHERRKMKHEIMSAQVEVIMMKSVIVKQ